MPATAGSRVPLVTCLSSPPALFPLCWLPPQVGPLPVVASVTWGSSRLTPSLISARDALPQGSRDAWGRDAH